MHADIGHGEAGRRHVVMRQCAIAGAFGERRGAFRDAVERFRSGIAQHRREQPVRRVHGEADMRSLQRQPSLIGPDAVQGRLLGQGLAAGGEDGMRHGEAGRAGDGIPFLAQREEAREVRARAHVEMRDVPLRLGEALRRSRARAVQRLRLACYGRWCRRLGCLRHVPRLDAPARAGAAQHRDLHTSLPRQPPRERRRNHAAVPRGWGRDRIHRCGPVRRRGTGLGLRPDRLGRAIAAPPRDHRPDRHRLARRHQQFLDLALARRFDLRRDLLGLDHKEHIAGSHAHARPNLPLREEPLGHGQAELRHEDLAGHAQPIVP